MRLLAAVNSTEDLVGANSVAVVVVHGATAGTARPTNATVVQWIGSVEPSNAQNGDLWISTA